MSDALACTDTACKAVRESQRIDIAHYKALVESKERELAALRGDVNSLSPRLPDDSLAWVQVVRDWGTHVARRRWVPLDVPGRDAAYWGAEAKSLCGVDVVGLAHVWPTKGATCPTCVAAAETARRDVIPTLFEVAP